MSETASKLLISPEAQANWVWVFKPKPRKRGDPMYMLDLIFNPAQMATPEFAAMKAAAQKAATDKFGDKLAVLIQTEKFISPFWKNERKLDPETGKMPPGYEAGGVYITVKSKDRPDVVQNTAAGLQPIIDENEMYSGCWVRVSLDCYAYDNESKGVNFGLRNVLKVRDGDPLSSGGRRKAEHDFAGIAAPPAAAVGSAATAASLF